MVHERRDLPGQRSPADHPARLPASDRPAPGSLADLRQRLDSLPPGHPSSPHGGDRTDHRQARPADHKPDQDRAPQDRPREDGAPQDSRPEDRSDQDRAPENRAVQDRAPDERAPEDQAVEDQGRDYWSEVPRFERQWAEHQEQWPAAATSPVDRSRDPEGSWRGNGNQYLSPDQHTRTQEVIASVRTVETTISAHMQEVERDNGCGSRLAGWEFRRKGEDRLKEKIADLTETGAPNASVAEVIRDIPDAIRYTFCSEAGRYNDAYWRIKDLLEARGLELVYSQNHWSESQYKGINTRWATQGGQRFEVQFHTPESLHAKHEITHRPYERIRDPLTPDGERLELGAFQREVCSWITPPERVSDVPNYRRGRPTDA